MPITLINSTFTDIFGNTSNVFKANAGDKVSCSFQIKTSTMSASNSSDVFTVDKLFNRISRTKGSWLDDGFRQGDSYVFSVVDQYNSIRGTFTGTINEVYDTYMIMTGLANVNGSSSSNELIFVLYTTNTFDYLKIGLNFVDNDNPSPTLLSPIDSESCVFSAEGLNSLAVSGQKSLYQLGKKSGGYELSSILITRNANILDPYGIGLNVKTFTITFDIFFYGYLFPDAFKGAKCFKFYSSFECKMAKDEKFNAYKFEINDKCSTGFFDEGYNSEQSNVISANVLSQYVYYNTESYVSFSVTLNKNTLTQFEIGAGYSTIDEDLNQNKKESQEYYLPTLNSGILTSSSAGWQSTSSSNYFSLTLVSITRTVQGNDVNFMGTIKVDPYYNSPTNFGKFIENRGDSDRLFYLWFKCGNTNTLLFGKQLDFAQPVGLDIVPDFSAYINHDNNNLFKDFSLPTQNLDINIHDNIAIVIDFSRSYYDVIGNVIAKIVCYNTNTDEEFVLESIVYDCSQQDTVNWVEMNQTLDYGLPASSNKSISWLGKTPYSNENNYKLRLYYPFLIRWEDWINELEATSFFKSKGTNTKNWINYTQSPYKLMFKLEIERNGVYDYTYKDLIIKNYDDSTIVSNIKIFSADGSKEYNTIPQGDKFLIKATHVHPTAFTGFPWGDITIEPQQGKPWQLMSTEIDCDLNNPLYGINNRRLELNLVSANTIELTCLLDSSKISDSFTITSKISEDGTDNNHVEYDKLMEDGTQKITEDLINKITD